MDELVFRGGVVERGPVFIRQVGDNDLSALHELDELVFGGFSYPLFVLREHIEVHRRHFLVADTGVGIIGYALAGLESGDDRAWLLRLGVRPDQRGLGYGRSLLVRSIRGLARAGAAMANFKISAENLTALRLAESVGFGIHDLQPDQRGSAQLLMSVRLGSGLAIKPDGSFSR